MIKKQIGWLNVEKETLPQLLLGGVFEGLNLLDDIVETQLDDSMVALGYEAVNDKISPFPSILIVSELRYREVFAWVSTYTPEIFPLSQHLRVMTLSEYETFRFFLKSKVTAKDDYPTSMLACLVLGELLAQVEGVDSLPSIPISRAMTCYLTPIARSYDIYKRRAVAEICLKRLSLFSQESRFSRKNINIEDVTSVLVLSESAFFNKGSSTEKIQIILGLVYKFEDNYYRITNEIFSEKILKDFDTNSFEKRVMAFREVARGVALYRVEGASDSYPAVVLAAAAYLVGRGASHVFLLKEWSKKFPSVYLWFGLICSLGGAQSWTVDWIKSIRLIEKMLRASFEITDPSTSDFYWLEFEWILKTFGSNDFFNQFPRFSPSGVTVEICPGVNYQYKLSQENTSVPQSALLAANKENYLSNDVQEIFSQFIDISKRVELLLNKDLPVKKGVRYEDDMKDKINAKKNKFRKTDT